MPVKSRGTKKRLKEWPGRMRPRERLWREGVQVLSDIELLAIILRTGTTECNVLQLATDLLLRFGGLSGLWRADLGELAAVKGVGSAKAAQIVAALELGCRLRREGVEERPLVTSPAAAAELVMEDMRGLEHEQFWVLLLDSKNRFLGREVVSSGGLNYTLVHPRDVFRTAIRKGASALILVHNHPSGDPTPSEDDVRLTVRLVKAGDVLGIVVVDHIVIGNRCYFSLKSEGMWP